MNGKDKEISLVKNTILFSVGNAGSKLLMLIIVPFYTYYVSVEQMGQYDVINTYVNLFAPVACLSLYEGVYRWLVSSDNSKEEIIRTAYTVAGVSVLIFDIGLVGFLTVFRNPFWIEYILYVNCICLYSLTQFTTRGLGHNSFYALQGIIYAAVLIAASVCFVFIGKYQARGLLYSAILANLITSIISLVVQKLLKKGTIRTRFNNELAIELIRYSIPLVPNAIAWWLVTGSSRIIINKHMGNVGNGILSIALRFPTIINLLTTFFYQAWQEQAIKEFNSTERDYYYSDIFNKYIVLLLSGVIALLPITKFIILYLMDTSYSASADYVWLLYLASVFNAVGAFYGTGYLSSKKTSGAFYTTIIGALMNVIICISFVARIGLYAAVIGNLAGNLVIWIIRMITMRRYFSIVVEWKRTLGLIVLYVAMALMCGESLLRLILLEICSLSFFVIINKGIIHNFVCLIGSKKKA